MSGKVILKVANGPMAGREFRFGDHNTLLVGRNPDCHIVLPENDLKVSGYHFILEVNPPDISLRDLGSLNGTFVNDVKYGGRERDASPGKAREQQGPDVQLRNGDHIRVGDTMMSLVIDASKFCCECGRELSGDLIEQSAQPKGIFICPSCRKHSTSSAQPLTLPYTPRCAKCSRDVSGEPGADRKGEYVCVECQSDVAKLVTEVLQLANQGEENLTAIRGYSKIHLLGRGGFGEVHLAQNDKTGEQVALKFMLPKVAVSKAAVVRFTREVEICRALKHDNIAELRDWGCSLGTFFFAMEYCEQGSVDDFMKHRRRPLSVDEAVPIILDVLNGLEYAHNVEMIVKLRDGMEWKVRGVVHRDLSPQNILLRGVGKRRVAKITDFGLAKSFDSAGLSGTTATKTGATAGKPSYVPRQQVINFKYAKPDVDVWAAAACLYYMLTCQYPRDFPKNEDPWRIVLDTIPEPIRERNSSIPERLAEVIDHALVDKPAIPIKSAAELKRELERVL